ncbi:copper amine oxidase N-terminal domain-containing protein [Acetivibrio clariflavus]|uniref:copper amine oxidase N-terminal domain-containing protein n=1 Tax=Acetivibrio clariflavus TaxID=288965 RepID=UPI0031F53A99
MLKRYLKFLTVVFIIIVLTSTVGVAEMPLRVVVNGDKVNFPDAQPFIDENGRTQVPVRFVSEALGANVDWNGDTKKVTVTLNSRKVVLTIGLKTYEINNQTYQMDTVALLKESRTFVPLRFVSEALGATVTWDQNARTVYTKFEPAASPAPITTPLAGTVKYYDGIAFNDVTDVDESGRMTIEKSKEFVLKLANQLSFIKENGKYYIKCDYPEIPESFQWDLTIRIYNKDGSQIEYSPLTREVDCQIPREGSFKKEATYVKDVNNIRNFSVYISIENSRMDATCLLNIPYYLDGSKKRIELIPYTSSYPPEEYTDNFDFNRMFQW